MALAVSAIAVTATALAGCATSAPESSDEPTTVVINQAVQTINYLPLYVAQEMGYFEDEGLDVKIDTGGSGTASFAAVLGGSAGFSIQDPVFVPKSHEQGGEGVVVAGILDRPVVFMVGKDSHDIQDDPTYLNGKKVIVSPAPDTTYALMDRMIKDYDLKDVELISVSLGNELAAVESGQADYALLNEPGVSQGIAGQGLHLVYSWADAGDDWNPFAYSSLTSTQTYIEQNPETAQKVVNAFQRAYGYIYDDPDGAAAVAEKVFTDLDPAVVQDAVKRVIAANGFAKTALVDEIAWDHNLTVAASVDNVKAYPSDATTYENNVNTELAAEAAKKYPAAQ
ncbi:NitT/TauT family transport system substrate-binding protein [Microbacterium foliorum]|uniref:ABC transporter substrate-binding protein n=1 Tax=Microbacterium foliorum TaxID=104336 RepID=UPI00209EDA3A|nr:ABC transporter substrate-binding protein [Microbacterium foliorum]MCP1428200.1 NitT/TauT family transport system substrate-binding protein [Microbacterium foliorum]